MFSVIRKREKYIEAIPTTVYDVHNDNCGYPHFLVYTDGEWKWMSAKHFIPVETFRTVTYN